MPALLEDPLSPLVYRVSGQEPFATAENPQIPSSIFPKTVALRDRVTIATLVPFFSPDDVPKRLLAYLGENLNKEIDGGDTYPMVDKLSVEAFGKYWFGNFGAVMILGDIGGVEAVSEMEDAGADWNKLCLGSFYVKPNYPGRSSHVCNGGFLVTPAARNKGVGKSMGQCYLEWAPQLNYTYSVFNLVYESNTASTKIWDSLGFKRIGRVPGCGNLKSFQEPVDAIIYGRDLKSDGDVVGNEERFDKIRYYLRHSSYPQGADRSEKSRLRSAATHYKLIPADGSEPEKLMLKDKEVISDPQAQYDIAKQTHLVHHGGINKTTAMIATKYHWVRIKETVSHVIKDCPECKVPANKSSTARADSGKRAKSADSPTPTASEPSIPQNQAHPPETPPLRGLGNVGNLSPTHISPHQFGNMDAGVGLPDDPGLHELDPSYDDMALDPTIIAQIQAQMAQDEFESHHHDYTQAAGLAEYVEGVALTQQHQDSNPFHRGHPDQGFSAPHPEQNFSPNHHDPAFSRQHSDQTFGPPHHDPGFNGQHPEQQFIHNPGQAMMQQDHVMDGTDGTGLNNMQPMQNALLPMDYMNGTSNGDYKPQ